MINKDIIYGLGVGYFISAMTFLLNFNRFVTNKFMGSIFLFLALVCFIIIIKQNTTPNVNHGKQKLSNTKETN